MSDVSAVKYAVTFLLPALDLGHTPTGIFVERNVEFFNQLGVAAFYVKGVIFGVVLARFGAVISQFVDIIEPNHVAVLFPCVHFLGTAFNFGIEVIALFVPNFKQPCHVVYTGDKLLSPFKAVGHSETV